MRQSGKKLLLRYCHYTIESDTYQHFMSIVLCFVDGNIHQQLKKARFQSHNREIECWSVQDEVEIEIKTKPKQTMNE